MTQDEHAVDLTYRQLKARKPPRREQETRMIVIHTPTGTHEFPGEHEVTNTGGTLKLTRAGKPVAAFREWSYWKETPEAPERKTVKIG